MHRATLDQIRILVSSNPNDDYLARIKAEIRAEADAARERAPLPRLDPPPRAAVTVDDGIDRERLDYSLGELCGHDYIAFIDHAFRALLKRAPDDTGSALQIRLLAAGAPKAEVLGNLRWSPEGRRVGARVRGLLPRYALAKLARVPVAGYLLQWGLALAGLPLLLRHQRASDTLHAARFNAVADERREHARRLDELQARQDAFNAVHGEMRNELTRLAQRLDTLEQRAKALEHHAGALQQRSDATTHELADLRHYVHTANHWVASLQRSLDELETAEAAESARADELLAALAEPDTDARAARHAAWSAALAAALPPAARVLDLGSGDGRWLAALRAHGLDAHGVEVNRVLVERARAQARPVALGEPLAALERCAEASLDALTLAATLADDALGTANLLHAARRALKPDGVLLLRAEATPCAAAGTEPPHWRALLAAAGFAAPSETAAPHAGAVLARRGAD
ncbi:MAG: methyltransferase domain-containing protein [Rhodanobacteraceae bacterium]|nr:methyltransferase domain-containing protein [Rhodanobacteraceae bacterium]